MYLLIKDFLLFKLYSLPHFIHSIAQNFIMDLHWLAKFCNFNTSLDEMLRNLIVCSIQDEAIKQKLLAKNKLTLTRATEIRIEIVATACDDMNLKQVTSQVNKIWLHSLKIVQKKALKLILLGLLLKQENEIPWHFPDHFKKTFCLVQESATFWVERVKNYNLQNFKVFKKPQNFSCQQ